MLLIGTSVIVKTLIAARAGNVQNVVLARSASAQLRELALAGERVTGEVIPFIQRVGKLQFAVTGVDEALAGYIRRDVEYTAETLQASVGRIAIEYRVLKPVWPDALDTQMLENLGESVATLRSVVSDVIDTPGPAALQARAPAAVEAAKEIGGVIDGIKQMVTLMTLEAQTDMRSAARSAIAANERSLENTSSVNASIQGSIRRTMITMAVSVAAALILGVTVFVFLRRRIREVSGVVRRLSNGDLAIELGPRPNDELGRLADDVMRMTSALRDRARTAESIANRDLSGEFRADSEQDVLGQALRGMLFNLNQDLARVAAATQSLDGETAQVSTASQQLAQGANEQSATLHQVAASMDTLAEKTRSNAATAGQLSEIVGATEAQAIAASQRADELQASMTAIQVSSANIARVMAAIDEVAYQTNLLAINAAIEAAQAGDAGKGFGVVAKEVRTLAERCAQASKDTRELVQLALRTVDEGMRSADAATGALGDIATGVQEMARLASDFDAQSADQAARITEINTGLAYVNKVTQQTTEVAERNATSSKKLSIQTAGLKHIVATFELRAGAAA
ncbi:MAG: methyl-accepting chemotaxis protein [Gammaproteobacteria bacterium]